ncbi:MAG TPA: hypothetical protein VMT76_00935 [Puia sp.]|nr:hypothetical protein [Puia sp.]
MKNRVIIANIFIVLIKEPFIVLLFLLLWISECKSQTEGLNNIVSDFNLYNQTHVQEKIYAHTNKAFYVAGEILWFKLYLVDATLNKPIDLSKVAYVEIINKNKKPVSQAKIAMKNGFGNGSFFLPLSLNSGNYKLRAYTNWMKNFSPNLYFEKDITIVNALKKPDYSGFPDSTKFDIRFFPEGGNLVSGIESKVAFRVIDHSGKGVDCIGSIIDQNNNSIVSFQTEQFGIGQFLFKPVRGNTYKAIMRPGKNNAILTELPVIYNNGYTLQLEDVDSAHIRINVRTDITSENQVVYLLVHTAQKIKDAEVLVLTNGYASTLIDKKNLGDGVSHFILFNVLKQPLCERLFFKRPDSRTEIEVNANEEEYKRRKKVYVNIFAKDEKNHPVTANLSLSVFREDALQSESKENISTYLLLTSELSGTVESPEYYLKNDDRGTNHAIDNLMLTQGWRRFKWDDVTEKRKGAFEFLPEYEGHIITGKVTEKKTGLPAENVNSFFSVPGEQYQLCGAVSDKSGKITFDIKHFYGAHEVVVEAGKSPDSNYRVDIYSPFSEKFSGSRFPDFTLSEALKQSLKINSLSSQVQNNFYTEALRKFMLPPGTQDSTAFFGQPDRKYFLDDYTRFSTMEEVMREIVTEILVKKHQGAFHINVKEKTFPDFFNDDPLILLDGVPVNINKIFSLDPLQVKKIEVVHDEYFLGPIDAEGIISYNTYKGDLGGFQLDPNSVILEYDGLQLQREFYSPRYNLREETESRMPDFRSVLFWSPDIITDKDGKYQLSFYTSDLTGKFIIVTEGLSQDGRTGSQLTRFEVTR